MYELNHRGYMARCLGACPSNNPHWQDRYFFMRNSPDLPSLNIPVIWRNGVGVGEGRPHLTEEEIDAAKKLWL